MFTHVIAGFFHVLMAIGNIYLLALLLRLVGELRPPARNWSPVAASVILTEGFVQFICESLQTAYGKTPRPRACTVLAILAITLAEAIFGLLP